MNPNSAFIVLPLIALVLGSLSVAALWLWWQMSRGEEPEQAADQSEVDPPEGATAEADQPAVDEASDPTIGQFIGRLAQRVQSAIPTREAAPTPSSALRTAGGAIEVMRVLRDLADGSLIVEIDGVRYRSLREIGDPEVGRRFLGNVQALALFARLSKAEATPLEETGAPSPASQPPVPFEPAASDQPYQAAPPQTDYSPVPPFQTSSQTASPKQERRGGLFRQQAKDEEPTPERNMTEEIEALLQYRLERTPEMVHRSIHIRQGATGVHVEVDGNIYEGVGEVPDSEVRTFIQAVIREWEARQ